jgi:hypothetical protein
MTTITLPEEIEGPLAEEARRKGTTPERLALDTLRLRFVAAVAPPSEQAPGSNLAGFLAGYIGLVAGSTEPFSERCGERLAEGLVEDALRERP